MRNHHGFLLIWSLTLVLAACGGQADPEAVDRSADVGGTWDGQVVETSTPIVLELAQSKTAVRGSVSIDILPIPVPVNGTVSGTRLLLSADVPATTVAIDANVVGTTMEGTISIDVGIGTALTGTFTASRR